MKRILPILCLLVSLSYSFTQNNPETFCGYDQHSEQLLEQSEYQDRQKAFELFYQDYVSQTFRKRIAVDIMPVVFHIIHDGHDLGSDENPDNPSVIQKLSDANDYFRHVSGNSYGNPYSGIDTEIEICLADEDPLGNYTTGIIRHVDSLTFRNPGQELINFINSVKWDTDKYINVFLIRYIPDVLGVYYGGSTDVVALRSTTSAGLLVHELGHYFSLLHTFQSVCPNGGCLTAGDKVCDTPPKGYSGLSGSCGNPGNSCTTDADDSSNNNPYRDIALGGLGDVNDLNENYMDYTEGCWGAFTVGQKDRMKAHIMLNRQTNINHAAIACGNAYNPLVDLELMEFAITDTVCNDYFSNSICVRNNGSTSVSSFDLEYYINGVSVHTESWSGSLANGQTTNVVCSVDLLKPEGRNSVEVLLTNISAGADEFDNDNSIKRYIRYFGQGISLPYSSSYDVVHFPELWEVESTEMRWSMNGYSGLDGCQNDNRLFCYNYGPSNWVDSAAIILPPVNLFDYSDAQFSFDYGYIPYNATQPDTLSIYLITDCGSKSLLWQKTDLDLATNDPPAYSNMYVYPECMDMDHIDINIAAYACSEKVQIMVDYSGYGNTAFIMDNLEINGLAPCVPDGCTYLVDPTALSINVSPDSDIQWMSVTGAQGYKLSLGTSSSNYDLMNNVDIGNNTTFDPDFLFPCNSDIYALITPYTGMGDNAGCVEEHFEVLDQLSCYPTFTDILVDNSFSSPFCIAAADLDKDGDRDIISGSILNEVSWYENINGTYTKHIIDNAISGSTSVTVVDIDADNDIDIVGTLRYDGDVVVWLNDGNENFTKQDIDNSSYRPESTLVFDVDGDMDLDVVACTWQWGDVVWYENVGSYSFNLHLIDGVLFGATSLWLTDIDKDNKYDILATGQTADDLVWYKGDGTGNFTKNVIDANLDATTSAITFDIDEDGDLDVLATARSNEVVLYENDGSQNFTKVLIDDTLIDPTDIHAVDVDLDGDTDLVVSASDFINLVWYENQMGSFTRYTILSGVGDIWSIDIGDMNGDLVPDIVLPLNDADKLSYLEHECSWPVNIELVNPVNGDTDVPVVTDIEWNAINLPSGLKMGVGTAIGALDILPVQDFGLNNPIQLSSDLPVNEEVHLSFLPYDANGQIISCSNASFYTESCPPNLPVTLDPIPSGTYYVPMGTVINDISVSVGQTVKLYLESDLLIEPLMETLPNAVLEIHVFPCNN